MGMTQEDEGYEVQQRRERYILIHNFTDDNINIIY